jgi:alkaline phosphatase D
MLAGLSPAGAAPASDSWDGYRASRARLIGQLGPAGIPDVVTLTGDYHSSWAMDVALDPLSEAAYRPATGQGSRAVEFIVPAISSAPLAANAEVPAGYAAHARQLPHVHGIDVDHNGYMLLDVDRERVQAEWYFEGDVRRPVPDDHFAGAFATARGAHRVERLATPGRLGTL